MAFKKEKPEQPEVKIAKLMVEIQDELNKIDSLEVYNQIFRGFVKREVDHMKWRHPDWLK